MSAMAKPIQCALAKQRFIKDAHPFLDRTIRCDDGRRPRVPLDNQIVKVRAGLTG